MSHRAQFGPNGNPMGIQTPLQLVEFLEKGGVVQLGTFSSPTYCSGWWDEYQVRGRFVYLTTDLSDTEHYDPARVRVYRMPWGVFRALIESGEERPGDALHWAWRQGWEGGLWKRVKVKVRGPGGASPRGA